MICPGCGNEISDGSGFCIYCGKTLEQVPQNNAPVQNAVPVQNVTPPQQETFSHTMKCPKCGSNNLQITTEVESHGKDYSATKGCIGWLLFGPLGFLCGLCGQNKKIKSKSMWRCINCGNTFKDADVLREEIKGAKVSFIAMMFLAAVIVIGALGGAVVMLADGEAMLGLLFAVLLGGLGGICAVAGLSCKKQADKAREELKQNFGVEE